MAAVVRVFFKVPLAVGGSRDSSLGFWVQGLWFRVQFDFFFFAVGFRFWGLTFRI